MKNRKYGSWTLAGVLISALWPASLSAAEGKALELPPPPGFYYPQEVHNRVQALEKAGPPVTFQDKVIFSYQPPLESFRDRPRSVSVAFEHENYTNKHLFWINSSGVYFFVENLPKPSPAVLKYRFIVDGLWMPDPRNPESEVSSVGFRVSTLQLRDETVHPRESPVMGEAGQVEFHYYGPEGQRVHVSGSFCHWDPYLYEMDEDPEEPGHYSLTVTLPPGTYYYRYVIGIKDFPDPLNRNHSWDEAGRMVSLLKNERSYKSTLPPAQWAPDVYSNDSHSDAHSNESSSAGH